MINCISLQDDGMSQCLQLQDQMSVNIYFHMRLFETFATFTAADAFAWFSLFSFFQLNLPEQRRAGLLMEPQPITMVNMNKCAKNSERASSHSKSQLSGGTEKRDPSFRGRINVNGSISITCSSLIKQHSSSKGDKAVFIVTHSLYLCFCCVSGLCLIQRCDVCRRLSALLR